MACSVLKHYNAGYNHPSLPLFDDYLEKNYKNVVVMVFDGMGVEALELHLPKDSFLRKHFVAEISTVFPPTTTAATTSIESGLTPAEHGWLGWSLYFSEIDKIVNAFINTEKGTGRIAADYHVAERFIPYKTIYDKIRDAGMARTYSVSPFGTNQISAFDELFEEVITLCEKDERKYIYTYWDEPDASMHDYGCDSETVTQWIQDINRNVEMMCNKVQDTLVIITADHGHINVCYNILSDYPSLLNMLKRPIAIESRAACFYIKEEYQTQFPIEFRRIFGNDYLLLSKDEVMTQKLFGDGELTPKFNEFIGDYLAIAIADKGIVYSHDSMQFLSNHAGMTESEMMVPFIVVEIK